MILLAVNFHYVSEEPREGRAIFPVSKDELRAQVEELARTFELISRDELVAAEREGAPLPPRACAITFDDGLRSQFELALPVLERAGAPATFFVPAQPLTERRGLTVHKLHHLRETMEDGDFREAVEVALAGRGLVAPEVADEDAQRVYRYDTPEAARLKFLLNMALPADVASALIDDVFAVVGESEESFCERTYMSAAQVRELEREHGAVGSHGYAHRPLGRLNQTTLRDDLERAALALEQLLGSRPLAVSYPYGSPDAATPAVGEAAAAVGHVVGFTMERAFNRSLREPLLLARIDANDTPAGRTPRFSFDAAGELSTDGMTPARTIWFDELASAA